jgi:transposase
VYREVIRELKRQQNITGKTIRVADKGLNCAQNIYDALSQGDGYIFSKSVKTLNKAEREWALNTEGFIQSDDSDKDAFWMKSCVDEYTYEFKEVSGRKKKFKVKEKRIVTYSPKLERKHREEINKMVAKAESCRLCEAKKSEYGESSKYLTFSSADENGDPAGKAVVQLDQKKIDKDLDCAGFNMIVTSEVTMGDREIYDTYHELWRIEESFRTLKTQLTARPVFLKNIDRIKGHFLICYLCVVLERILQFKVLKNQFGSEEVYEFIRGFKIVPDTSASYINMSKTSGVGIFLRDNYNLPLTNYFLRKRDIKKITERAL